MNNKQAIEILEEIKQAYENTPLAEYMGNPEYIALPAKIEAIDGAIHRIKHLPEPSRYQTAKEVLSEFAGGDIFEFSSHEVHHFEKWLEEKQRTQ